MQILGQRLLHLLGPDLPATVKTSSFKGSKQSPAACKLTAGRPGQSEAFVVF